MTGPCQISSTMLKMFWRKLLAEQYLYDIGSLIAYLRGNPYILLLRLDLCQPWQKILKILSRQWMSVMLKQKNCVFIVKKLSRFCLNQNWCYLRMPVAIRKKVREFSYEILNRVYVFKLWSHICDIYFCTAKPYTTYLPPIT